MMKRIALPILSALAFALIYSCGAQITPTQSPTGVQQTLDNTAPANDAVSVAAASVPASDAPVLTEVQYRGKDLYDMHCGQCHKLYDPKAFTQEQWDPILVRMQKQANLADGQMADIRAYIAVYAE